MDFCFEIESGASCPLRGFVIRADHNYLYGLEFVLKEDGRPGATTEPNPVHRATCRQLSSYLAGKLRVFDLPLMPKGTVFQQKVWKEIAAIPFGTTVTYGEIARRLGDPHLARAVGQAANRNPLPVVIPCHRVVGQGGHLTGFAPGLPTKVFLLGLEKGDMLWQVREAGASVF
jgi:methylated-DNA-[protein]-cysteine S-methyltransferase